MQKDIEKKTEGLVSPSYAKTIFAYLIDFACIVITMLIVYFGISKPFIGPANNIDGIEKEFTSFQLSSSLIENSSFYNFPAYDKENNIYGYSRYEDVVWKYYTVFLPNNGNAVFFDEDKFEGDKSNQAEVGEWVYRNIYGLGEYKEDSFYNPIDASTDFKVKPSLKQSYIDALSSEKEADKTETATKLNQYYFKQEGQNVTGLYVDAVRHFSKQPYAIKLQKEYSNASYMMWLPTALIGPAIFLFIIPLCVPKGRTIGKLLLKTGVASKEGVDAAKWQIMVRYLFELLTWYVLALPVNLTFSITIFLTLLVGDFIVLMLSRSHRSIHDLISRTASFDIKKSTIYPVSSLDAEEVLVAKKEIEKTGVDYFNKPAKKMENDNPSFEVLDSSTIGKARKEAKEIVSFDEFENK